MATQLSVEYVDMSPERHAFWRGQLAELFAYVETIEVEESALIADSRTGAQQTTALPVSAS